MISESLLARVRTTLKGNDTGTFIKPSPGQYPHQWNWDSAVIALGLSYFDPARAWAEVESLLASQWRDGMVPHIIYHHGPSDYFPPPDFWQTAGLARAGDIPSSAFTQPPILATVVRMLLERPSTAGLIDDATLRRHYDRMLAWHRWLHVTRCPDGSGLPCLIHPWESGADNSPRWAAILDGITPADLPPYKRRDTVHVKVDERPRPEDYTRFVHMINLGRQLRWEPKALLDQMPFLVQDIMYIAILHRADEDLAWLGARLGADTGEIDAWRAGTTAIFDQRFWDEKRGFYYDYDARAGRRIDMASYAPFTTLFAGLPSAAQAERLVREHLLNPAEFAPGGALKVGVPTIAANEPLFGPRRYWCGPVWVIINWIIGIGLRRYGYDALADKLAADTLALVDDQGFHEYYDPRDGSACGAADFSWSAALALELAA